MDLDTFERQALRYWQAIPATFRRGVTAFVVDPGAFRKEEFEEGWVYGICEPDEAVMALPDAPVASRITLFYASFVHIASDDPDFDWEDELRETIRHELQHHLEWCAGDDHLGDEDDLQDDNERRRTGARFTPWFHRWGVPLGGGAWLGDDTLFVEVAVPRRRWEELGVGSSVHRWGALELRLPPLEREMLAEAADAGEPLYADADVLGVEDEDTAWPWDDVTLVLWRKRGWWPW